MRAFAYILHPSKRSIKWFETLQCTFRFEDSCKTFYCRRSLYLLVRSQASIVATWTLPTAGQWTMRTRCEKPKPASIGESANSSLSHCTFDFHNFWKEETAANSDRGKSWVCRMLGCCLATTATTTTMTMTTTMNYLEGVDRRKRASRVNGQNLRNRAQIRVYNRGRTGVWWEKSWLCFLHRKVCSTSSLWPPIASAFFRSLTLHLLYG